MWRLGVGFRGGALVGDFAEADEEGEGGGGGAGEWDDAAGLRRKK